jgi:hypothetical protein
MAMVDEERLKPTAAQLQEKCLSNVGVSTQDIKNPRRPEIAPVGDANVFARR